jgi:uridylate kinase
MIGIDTTKINAHMFSRVFESTQILKGLDDEITDNIVISPGFEPGHSTDYDAVYLANRFNKQVIILSNISKIYSSDPKTNPDAKPIDNISWKDLSQIVGKEFSPGASMPIDPVAISTGMTNHTKVIFADGKDLSNFENILNNKEFIGSTVF